jgi:hypothetical protein
VVCFNCTYIILRYTYFVNTEIFFSSCPRGKTGNFELCCGCGAAAVDGFSLGTGVQRSAQRGRVAGVLLRGLANAEGCWLTLSLYGSGLAGHAFPLRRLALSHWGMSGAGRCASALQAPGAAVPSLRALPPLGLAIIKAKGVPFPWSLLFSSVTVDRPAGKKMDSAKLVRAEIRGVP